MPEPVRGAQCLPGPWALGSGEGWGEGRDLRGTGSHSPTLPGQLTRAPGLTFSAGGFRAAGQGALPFSPPASLGPFPAPQHWGLRSFMPCYMQGPTRLLEQQAGPGSRSQVRILKTKTYLGMIFGLHSLKTGHNPASCPLPAEAQVDRNLKYIAETRGIEDCPGRFCVSSRDRTSGARETHIHLQSLNLFWNLTLS